jgi:hypothetical protein
MPKISRRDAVMATIGLSAAASLPQRTLGASPTGLREMPPSFKAVLPNTRYFEIDSKSVGARFGVWVTTPPMYDQEPERRYPAIYQPDGNSAILAIGGDLPLLPYDPIFPIVPFVSVCVGYTGVDAARSLAVRARDLIPPGEPPPPGMSSDMTPTQYAAVRDGMVIAGILDAAGAELYIHNLLNPTGDRFLAFLTEELHPLLAANFRITDDAGLFGYSYGGLFATYAALRRPALFKRIGAGSPGILPRTSTVFTLYDEALRTGQDFTGRMLHMTYCEPELTERSLYQPMVAEGSTQFISLAGQRPLKGLAFSSHIIPNESHITGTGPSHASFLRRFYAAAKAPPA